MAFYIAERLKIVFLSGYQTHWLAWSVREDHCMHALFFTELCSSEVFEFNYGGASFLNGFVLLRQLKVLPSQTPSWSHMRDSFRPL